LWIENPGGAASEVGVKSSSTKPLIVSSRATVENFTDPCRIHTIPYRKDDVRAIELYVTECTQFAAASANMVFGLMRRLFGKD
jgi:hypothetical protein